MENPKPISSPEKREKEDLSHLEILQNAGHLLQRLFTLCPNKIDRRIIMPGLLDDMQKNERGRCLTRFDSAVDFTIARIGEERNDMTEVMIHIYPGDIDMTQLFAGIEQGLSNEWIMKHEPSSPFRGQEIRKYLKTKGAQGIDLISIKLLYNGAGAQNRAYGAKKSPIAMEISLDMIDDNRIKFDPLIAYNDIQEQRGRYSRIMYARIIGVLENIVSREEIFRLQKALKTAFGKVDLFGAAKPQESNLDNQKDPTTLN